jgi:hypothetical protein
LRRRILGLGRWEGGPFQRGNCRGIVAGMADQLGATEPIAKLKNARIFFE